MRWDATARGRFIMMFLVVSLPLLAVVGTGNPIALNICYQAAPWWALGLALAVTTGRHLVSGGIPALFLIGAALLLGGQFVHGRVLSPYRLPGSLLDSSEAVAIGSPASHMLLDPRSAAFIREVQSSFGGCGFRPGGDVLAFFHMPGVVHAVGGIAPGYPWLPAGYPGSDRFVGDRLATLEDQRAAAAWIVEDDAPRAARLLQGRGLLFPRAYRLCGVVNSPYTDVPVRIWRRPESER
jgi:hypothetical protein